MKISRFIVGTGCLASMGCISQPPPEPYVPAMRYSTSPEAARQEGAGPRAALITRQGNMTDGRAKLRLAAGDTPSNDIVVYRSPDQIPASYKSGLALGDPGITSSLWRESRAGNDVFRDFRAWQPMDVVTIVVSENSKGMHDADTEIKSKSEVLAAIQHLLGFEDQVQEWDHVPNLNAIVQASTKNDFKGEGQTNRQAQLTARISAVVAEVLPSGLLRIEGEKIIAVNNEEQVMVISGLVRQRDINSKNEVNSSNIAQMRIDYYGKGIVGEAQYGGWLGRLMRYLWPF